MCTLWRSTGTSTKRAGNVDEDSGQTGTLLPRQSQVLATDVASPMAVARGRDLPAEGGKIGAPCNPWRRRTIVWPESAQTDHPQRFAALASQSRQFTYTHFKQYTIISYF